MSALLTDEIRSLQGVVRDFVRRELLPLEIAYPGGPAPAEALEAAARTAQSSDLWLFEVPEELGGAGLPYLGMCAVWEELYRTWALPDRGVTVFGPQVGPILLSLRKEQQEAYLTPVLEGRLRTAFAQTEPDAGSDPASMRSTARKVEGGWTLSGTKRFITGADSADFFQFIAKAEPFDGHPGGFTCFLVPADASGIQLGGYSETLTGERSWEIYATDVFVSDDAVAGEVGEGFKLAQKWIVRGRLHQAARAVAIAQRCMELTVRYAQSREVFGRPLIKRQAVEHMLIEAHTALASARLCLHECAAAGDRGQDVRYSSAAVKVQAVEMASQVIDTSIQIHGGTGLMREMPFARWAMDMRSRRITEGASEVMKSYAARSLPSIYGSA
jgi:acyl-CoA dehydrogenase